MKIIIYSAFVILAAISGTPFIFPAQAGTPTLTLTVTSQITMGTCTAELLDDNGNTTNIIAFGNIYISELEAKSKIKSFKLRFTNCEGIPKRQAKVTLAPRGTTCAATNSAAFANNIPDTENKAQHTAVEIWTTRTPEGNDSVQLQCFNPNTQLVDISAATGQQYVEYILSARMVVEPGQSSSAVTTGDFTSPATFTITYE